MRGRYFNRRASARHPQAASEAQEIQLDAMAWVGSRRLPRVAAYPVEAGDDASETTGRVPANRACRQPIYPITTQRLPDRNRTLGTMRSDNAFMKRNAQSGMT